MHRGDAGCAIVVPIGAVRAVIEVADDSAIEVRVDPSHRPKMGPT